MSQIHYFQRYSSFENSVTNNTLQLLARIYSYSPNQASKVLTEITGLPIEIGIEINQQQRAKESIPDGMILQRSFKVLIESKVDAGVNADQLLRHGANFEAEEQKILLLLTKQSLGKDAEKLAKQIAAQYPDVIFKNVTYEDVCKAVEGLFKDHEGEMAALVGDYVEYCNDAKLFDQSPYLMRIVPCGDTLDLNIRYGIYFNPSDKPYTKHSYLGIYANKAVQCIWQIDSVFDAEWNGTRLKKTLIQGRDTSDYDKKLVAIIKKAKDQGRDISTGRRFFCGMPVATDFRKSSPGGIQGPRNIKLRDTIGAFSDVQDVATKLRAVNWQ